nr:MAG TPA: hypothetical protein [Caudoviricetes sp.]DAZ27648.1 MAG TPA: hypothetical protein [Caudoviricetes sp.]
MKIKSIILFIHLYLLRKSPDCCIDVCNKLKKYFFGSVCLWGCCIFYPHRPRTGRWGFFAAYRRHRLLAAYPQYQFNVWQVNPKTG